MKYLCNWLACCLLSSVSLAAEKVTVDEAEKLIEGKIQLLDVRTLKEWKAGYIEGADRVDFYEDGFGDKVKEKFEQDRAILVYCRSGGRSVKATQILEEVGFVTVKDLDGGFMAWEKAGKDVVRPEPDDE